MRIDSSDDFARATGAREIGFLLGVPNSEHFRTMQDVDRFHVRGQRVSRRTYKPATCMATAPRSGATRG